MNVTPGYFSFWWGFFYLPYPVSNVAPFRSRIHPAEYGSTPSRSDFPHRKTLSFVSQFETMFDPLKTIHNPIDGRLLSGTGFITDDNFSTHQRQACFLTLKA
jgi:hypothetical protein